MGTTQRIGTGVKNEPNWGNLSSSITSAAKAVLDIEKEEEKPDAVHPQDISKQEKRYSDLVKRRDKHVRSTFERLVKLGGGSKIISSGGSAKVGRAGLKSSGRLATFFSGVSSNGLAPTLIAIGFGTLVGKTVQDVIDYLIAYCGDSAVGMDETAANEAISVVLRELELEANENVDNLGDIFKEYADSEKLAELLCQFFGVYIFEYLSERFEERLRQIRGEEVTKETFDHIRKDILGRVERLNKIRPITKIDWAGREGKVEIEKIFESILKIEE